LEWPLNGIAFSSDKQPLGYVLIPGGLPNGSDRPLVYSRCDMTDGLFFRRDEPEYAYYSSDGSRNSQKNMKHGGQFYDVARWQPPNRPGPTTQALP